MVTCYFVSDLHGMEERYASLFSIILNQPPQAVFLGGDLMPNFFLQKTGHFSGKDFFAYYFKPQFQKLKDALGKEYPAVFLILGNDDPRCEEAFFAQETELWHYLHNRKTDFMGYAIYGYNYVPPTPFLLKDWERWDVSRFLDVGALAPTEGYRTMPAADDENYRTIKEDLEMLVPASEGKKSIFLFHTPPYQTKLDRAALDGQMIDYAPLDVHVGSIAVKRFIEKQQPHLTMHGHVHESTRITGSFIDSIKETIMLQAAHDGKELSLLLFDLDCPQKAKRLIL